MTLVQKAREAIGPGAVSPRKKYLALGVAAIADIVQVVFWPIMGEGALSPFEDALDIGIAVILMLILGFQWRLAFAFGMELVPGMDLFPTWTAVVLSVPTHAPLPGEAAVPGLPGTAPLTAELPKTAPPRFLSDALGVVAAGVSLYGGSMHRFARAFLVSVPACAVLLAAKPASADLLDVGVGVIGSFGGNFIGKGSAPANQDPNALTYPGFGGTTLGYGLMVDVRVLKFLGLEVDFIKMQNRGHGDVTWTRRDAATGAVQTNDAFTVEVGQDAWHVPVLAKVVLPSPLIAPFAELGPEFVFVGTPTATVTSGTAPWPMSANASNYTMFTFGVGFELKLPIPEIDIRIPFTIRGSYNPSVPASSSDRQTVTTTGTGAAGNPASATYMSQFEWQALATLGAGIYF